MGERFVPEEPEVARDRDAYEARVRDAIEIATVGRTPARLAKPTRGDSDLVAADQWENRATVWFNNQGHHGEFVDEHVDLKHNGTRWEFQDRSLMGPGTEFATRVCISEIDDQVSNPFFVEDVPYGCRLGGGHKTRRYATVRFQVAIEVIALSFDDREQRQVADHGYCLVSYDPKQPPAVTGLGANGVDLGSFTPRRIEPQRRTFGFRSLLRGRIPSANGRVRYGDASDRRSVRFGIRRVADGLSG